MDFDLSLVRHEIVRAIIHKAITLFEDSGSSPSVNTLLDDFEDDPVSCHLISTAAAKRVAISSEWVDSELSDVELREHIRLASYQSASLLSKGAWERQLTSVKQQLAGDIDESELHSLLEQSIQLSKRIDETRSIQTRLPQ
jgi:hypothetical protein